MAVASEVLVTDSETPKDPPLPERPGVPPADAVGEPPRAAAPSGPPTTPPHASTPVPGLPPTAPEGPAPSPPESVSGAPAPTAAPVSGAPSSPFAPAGPSDGAPAGPAGARGFAGAVAKRLDPRPAWVLAAVVCLIVGAVASLLAAHTLASNDASGARRASRQAGTALAATAKVALEREQDLGVSASTFLAADPKASAAEFSGWARWAQTLRRYPELDQLGLVTIVRAGELPSFRGTAAPTPLASGPAAPPPARGTRSAAAARASAPVSVTPAGARAYYCLATGSLTRSASERAPAGLDYCRTRHGLLLSRDSQRGYYTPVSAADGQALEALLPVYRGNQPPASLTDRIAAFVGWAREVFTPGVLARELLQGSANEGVRMSFDASGTSFVVSAGPVDHGEASTAIEVAHTGWTVQGFGAPVASGISSDGDALALLIAGLTASVLLALFVLGLGGAEGGSAKASVPREGGGSDLYDRLTGLPNRALMLDRAECMLARAGRQPGLLVGALFIDLDWFAGVNERLGRDAGDEVLKIVGQRLETVVRAGDTVGRLGSDEYVLLVETAARGARLDSLARRVVEGLHKPFELDDAGPAFVMTASIGVAFGRYASADDLLRDAQLALHAAKSAGKDRYTLFNANMRSVIEGRGVLEAELNRGLAEKQFFLLYEPIFELATGQVAGMEALVRWLHPKQGVLAPNDFFPLAEETGLSVPIGRWMLEEACTRAAAWNVAGYPIGISVEVSPAQLNREGFITDLRRALQQSGIQPALLTLSIAETTVMRNVNTAVERLDEIKRLGVRIAIDDFGGSGYAYHSDLRRLPLDFLKVDRSSLAASEDEEYRSWLLEAIMIVGRELSLAVIAKGIESLDQMAALQEMGCTMAQGALMGKPVPASNLETALVSRLPLARADAQNA